MKQEADENLNKIPLNLLNHRFYAPLVIVQRRTMGAGPYFGGKANNLARKFAETRLKAGCEFMEKKLKAKGGDMENISIKYYLILLNIMLYGFPVLRSNAHA